MLERDYYRLPELAQRWACTVDDLLHLGTQGHAQICVNIYGMGRGTRLAPAPGALPEDYPLTDEERRNEEAYAAAFERCKNRTTKDIPYGVYVLENCDLRRMEMPDASPHELLTALRFDGVDDGWWLYAFYSPVTIKLDHLCILHEEVLRLDREVFGAGARVSDAQGASAPLHPQAETADVQTPQHGHPMNSPRPLQRQAAQGLAILEAIRQAGFDPLRLPKNEPGKPGIKAKVCKALNDNPMFTGKTVFNRAWERLRGCGDIAYTD